MKTIFIVLIIILVLLIIWVIKTYNNFVTLKAKVDEAFSTMDVYLKKRYDLIPNFVETVKGYASHEKETLTSVIEARAKAMNVTASKRDEAEGELGQALSRLMMLKESYPELKADQHFLALESQLSSLEEEIERSRRYYNGIVRALNESVNKIPSCIIANLFGIKEVKYFEIQNQEQRENVKVQF